MASHPAAESNLTIRYMGTKRLLVPHVCGAIRQLEPRGSVADLFCGMGSVAVGLAPDISVFANDVLAFPAAFARTRFLDGPLESGNELSEMIEPLYRDALKDLRRRWGARLGREERALKKGKASLASYLKYAPHVGNSHYLKRLAQDAKQLDSKHDYILATSYFAPGYFSTAQGLELDALRWAIDQIDNRWSRNALLCAWLSAASAVINAPGHAAQYLKPTSRQAMTRISKQWQRNIWDVFLGKLALLTPVGNQEWRRTNRVSNTEALSLLKSDQLEGVGVVYADPPYTKDQYSRYYHVYETLYRYDFPDSKGEGRYPSGRFVSPFSLLTKVEATFRDMCTHIANKGLDLVLSYPADGLLTRRTDVSTALKEFFVLKDVITLKHKHSTMGASSGETTKLAKEVIYVCAAR